MKQNTKNDFMQLFSSFLTSVVLSAVCVVAVNIIYPLPSKQQALIQLQRLWVTL